MMNSQCRQTVDEAILILRDPTLAALFEEKFAAAQLAVQVLHIQGVMDKPEYEQYKARLTSARAHRETLNHRKVRLEQR